MDFNEWWHKKAPDINRAFSSTNEYLKPYFENAFEHGKACGENPKHGICQKCGEVTGFCECPMGDL